MATLLTDLYIVLSISLLAILFGIVSAFYLEEWLLKTNRIRRLIESIVAILSGIPSILYGILAVGIFFTDAGALKAVGIQNTGTSAVKITPFQRDATMLYAEVFIFIVMVMPLTIRKTQAALRSVETPIREAAYVLGASQWQVLMKQVLPPAFPEILAGGCRAMSRAFATAALIIGFYIWQYATDPGEMTNKFMLFLGGALFLSLLSSTLVTMVGSASA